MVLEQLDINMQKNEVGTLYILILTQMDQKLKYKE